MRRPLVFLAVLSICFLLATSIFLLTRPLPPNETQFLDSMGPQTIGPSVEPSDPTTSVVRPTYTLVLQFQRKPEEVLSKLKEELLQKRVWQVSVDNDYQTVFCPDTQGTKFIALLTKGADGAGDWPSSISCIVRFTRAAILADRTRALFGVLK